LPLEGPSSALRGQVSAGPSWIARIPEFTEETGPGSLGLMLVVDGACLVVRGTGSEKWPSGQFNCTTRSSNCGREPARIQEEAVSGLDFTSATWRQRPWSLAVLRELHGSAVTLASYPD
jgi:hypothetical protein